VSAFTDNINPAVEKLGPGAVPSAILEEMGVQGLTRGNISSHLQKYRLEARQKQLQKQAEEEQQLQQQHILQLQFQQHLQHDRVVKMVYPPLAVPPPSNAAHGPPSPSGANHLHSSGSASSLGAPAMMRGGSAYDVHEDYGADNGDLHLYLNTVGSLSESRGSATNVDLLFSSGGSTAAPMLSTASYNLAQSATSVPSSPNSGATSSNKTQAPYAAPYVWVDPSSASVEQRHYERTYGGGYHPTYSSVPYYCYGCSCGASAPGSHHHPTTMPPGSANQAPQQQGYPASSETSVIGMELVGGNTSSSNNNSSSSSQIASGAGGVDN